MISSHGLSGLGMFYSIWLLAAALAGWAGGKIAGDDGFGTGADILLGLTGAFVVRWSLENIGISLKEVYLVLFSIWGAAALPAALRLGLRRHNRSKARSRLQSEHPRSGHRLGFFDGSRSAPLPMVVRTMFHMEHFVQV